MPSLILMHQSKNQFVWFFVHFSIVLNADPGQWSKSSAKSHLVDIFSTQHVWFATYF